MFKGIIKHDSSRVSIKDDNVLTLLITHYTDISEGVLVIDAIFTDMHV